MPVINNGSPLRQLQHQPRNGTPNRKIGWKALVLIVVLINYVEITLYVAVSKAALAEAQSQAPQHTPSQYVETESSHERNPEIVNTPQRKDSYVPAAPNIVLAGMAYTDSSVSDFALQFLVDAACGYNIPSHILLEYREDKRPLNKKIAALTHHWHPLPANGKLDRHPACGKLIRVAVSPGKDALLNRTMAYHQSQGASILRKSTLAPNHPLSRSNRIARIKRAREYQRGLVREMMNTYNDGDMSKRSAIAVLDLDMLAYPPPQDLIETAREYIAVDGSEENAHKFHAICANGILVQKSRTWNGYIRRYYDTFSTIFLPNSWIHVDRLVPRGSLAGENVTMAKMNQEKSLAYILRKGKSKRTEGGGGKESQYVPVPMRSCFNGLTLYRADVWLEPKCRYDSYHEDDAVYVSKQYQHACEHVVFHECLRRTMKEGKGATGAGFRIAVIPDMTTLWHG